MHALMFKEENMKTGEPSFDVIAIFFNLSRTVIPTMVWSSLVDRLLTTPGAGETDTAVEVHCEK